MIVVILLDIKFQILLLLIKMERKFLLLLMISLSIFTK